MTRARSEEMGRIVPGLPLGWVKVKLKISTEINKMVIVFFGGGGKRRREERCFLFVCLFYIFNALSSVHYRRFNSFS